MLGGGMARQLVKKAVAASVAAGAALVAILALGATIFYALQLVVQPLAAAAITCLLFTVIALVVALFFVAGGEAGDDESEDDVRGLGERAYMLFRQRPILGTVAAAGGRLDLPPQPGAGHHGRGGFHRKNTRRPPAALSQTCARPLRRPSGTVAVDQTAAFSRCPASLGSGAVTARRVS